MANANASERSYEDFAPVSDFISEKECDTLLLYLPGFRKDQLKVQLTTLRILRVSGERPIGDNKYKRFHKEFQVPSNIDTKEMSAKFEGGILYIRQPKLITPVVKEQKYEEKPAEEPPKPQEQEQPAESPKPHEQEQPPKSEPQQDAPLEQKMEKEDERKQDVEMKGKSKLEEINRKLIGGGNELFKELRKPEKLKKLGVYVILLLIVGIQIIKMFRSFSKFEEQSFLENGHQEL